MYREDDIPSSNDAQKEESWSFLRLNYSFSKIKNFFVAKVNQK